MRHFTGSIRGVCLALALSAVAPAADHPGLAIYKEHCARCHAENGGGTKDVPDPLGGTCREDEHPE
ncbi:MAG: cytochrome c, partial [Planctomycetota bacterium]